MDLFLITQYLQQKGHGVEGQNLFAYFMPDAIMEGVLITAQMPIARHQYVNQLYRGQFQAIARGSEYEAIRHRLALVAETLNVQGLQLGDVRFHFISPIQAPLVYPRADSRLLEASVNFNFSLIQLT